VGWIAARAWRVNRQTGNVNSDLCLDMLSSMTPTPHLGERIDRALSLARELHSDQRRKGSEIPYLAHLLGVTSLVLEDGGSEDEAIAALLHDAVEDQGGAPTLALIEQRFGKHVAEIVEGCSDTDVIPKPPWKERKQAYIAHLSDAKPGVLRVSLADKLHNARSILFDLELVGDAVWDRFKADRADTILYYESLGAAFAARDAGPLVQELQRVVTALAAWSAR
jgi:(p)ppGpp synthase/HD superfamily hydrolase